MKRIAVGIGLTLLTCLAALLLAAPRPAMPVGQIVGTGAPAMDCLVGQLFFRTDAAAGANVYGCTALPNTWTLQGAAGGVVTYTFGCTFDGGGVAVTVGSVCYTRLPRSGTIIGYSVVAVGAGPTTTADVWKVAAGGALPANGNTITGGQEIALAANNAIHTVAAADIAKWNAAITAYDIAAINVDACANATWMQVLVYYQ